MIGEERWVGESNDDFPDVQISIAGGGGEMVCVLSLGRFFFFPFFFLLSCVICFYVQKALGSLSYEEKKNQ